MDELVKCLTEQRHFEEEVRHLIVEANAVAEYAFWKKLDVPSRSFNVLVFGDSGVGKSYLINRFLNMDVLPTSAESCPHLPLMIRGSTEFGMKITNQLELFKQPALPAAGKFRVKREELQAPQPQVQSDEDLVRQSSNNLQLATVTFSPEFLASFGTGTDSVGPCMGKGLCLYEIPGDWELSSVQSERFFEQLNPSELNPTIAIYMVDVHKSFSIQVSF